MGRSLHVGGTVLSANRPGEILADGVFQSLLVVGDGTDTEALRARIDNATDGKTKTLSVAAAAAAIPGVKEQQGTFGQIIGVTPGDRSSGHRTVLRTAHRRTNRALRRVESARRECRERSSPVWFLQAVLVTLIASVVAGALSFLLDALIPANSIPFAFGAQRLGTSVISLLFAAVVGCAFSLRRVLRIDPAQAIGGSL